MNTNDIINYVNDIKNQWQTNDPYAIADYLGITVLHTATCIKSFTAQTIKVNGYPTIISINDAYTEFSKKVLCAHELCHAFCFSYDIHMSIQEEEFLADWVSRYGRDLITILDDLMYIVLKNIQPNIRSFLRIILIINAQVTYFLFVIL